jgi:hypothetical protein
MSTSLIDADVTVVPAADAVCQLNLSRHENVLLYRKALLSVLEK